MKVILNVAPDAMTPRAEQQDTETETCDRKHPEWNERTRQKKKKKKEKKKCQTKKRGKQKMEQEKRGA